MEIDHCHFVFADSLRYTSALSVALAVVFLVITVGITVIKLINGSIMMPRLLPNVTDLTSFWELFTVVPVLVTAYICHYNGMQSYNSLNPLLPKIDKQYKWDDRLINIQIVPAK